MSLSRLVVVICAVAAPAVAADLFVSLHVDPPTVRLAGPDARYSLLVSGTRLDGRVVDLTADARLVGADGQIVRTDGNTVRGLRDGATTVRVEVHGQALTVPVQVTASANPRRFHFENDIEPLFARFGCNSSGCHGKAEGQNGFKLSVFGFDPQADYTALVKESRGRRVFPAAPERSLFLLKATGQVPHGGGIRIAAGSDAYETIRGWIAAGAPVGGADEPAVDRIRVEPAERVLDMRAAQQLRVVAHYTDGREVDVTHNARFQSNNDGVAAVTANGKLQTGDVPGEAAVMASFMNEVAVCRVLVPRAQAVEFPTLSANNFIDPSVLAEQGQVQIVNAISGNEDIDDRVTRSLKPFGLNLAEPAASNRPPIPKTVIYDYSGGAYPKTAEWLANYFDGATVIPVAAAAPGLQPSPFPIRGQNTSGLVVVLGQNFYAQFAGLRQ